MRLNTNLKKLKHKEIRNIVVETKQYCESKFGVNKRKGVCNITVRTQGKSDKYLKYGEYYPDGHKIVIYKNVCFNVRSLIKTTIHEYTHSLQPIKSKYWVLLKEYGYSKHPFEIEANEKQKSYKDAWKQIKPKMVK